MEKRKTLLLFNILIFTFLSIFVLSEKLNISGNTIIDNNEEIIAVDNSVDNSVDITDNEKVITNITTTTVPSLQDSYEEEMETNINFQLPDSDGVDIYTSKISIYSTEEQTILSKIIPGISLEQGCIIENINEIENQWINVLEANVYNEEKINFSLSVESSLPIDPTCLSNFITSILNDKRGWTTIVGKEFQVVNYYDADFHIFIANPDTVASLMVPEHFGMGSQCVPSQTYVLLHD